MKPKLKLTGINGNAMMLVAQAVKVAKANGWAQARIEKLKADAFSGDYDHLLNVLGENFDVC